MNQELTRNQRLVEDALKYVEALEAMSDDEVLSRLTRYQIEIDVHPQVYTGEMVREVRVALGASQSVFAKFLGVSKNAVSGWERGAGRPNSSTARFLDEIRAAPTHFATRLRSSVVKRERSRSASPAGTHH